MIGVRIGPAIANAIFTFGANADIRDPNAVVTFATKITVRQQTRYLRGSLLRLHIQ